MLVHVTSRFVNRPTSKRAIGGAHLISQALTGRYKGGIHIAQLYYGPLEGQSEIGLVLDHDEHGPLRGRKSGRIVNGPTMLWAFSRTKEKPGWYWTMKGMGH